MTEEEFAIILCDHIRYGASVSDIMQIITDREKKMRHYIDTSIGLWCFDRNPQEVTKEWIDENSFQLTV